MKKIISLIVGLFVIFGFSVPTHALYGPEPSSSPRNFEIIFEEAGRPDGNLVYERMPFSMDDGWDFEDRDGYECANIARYDAQGNLLLLLDFEQSKDYQTGIVGGTFRINDRGGVEPGDGDNPDVPRDCGNETKDDPSTPKVNEAVDSSRWAPSGEDHFPHITEGTNPETHGVRIYRDGVVDNVATNSLNAVLFNDECDRDYWSPGDPPELEFINWWDEDGPEDAHHDGSAPLDCGSGGDEPVAVARAHFSYLAPNMGVCILDHDHLEGAWCSGMVTPPEPSPTPPPCVVNPKTGQCKPVKN